MIIFLHGDNKFKLIQKKKELKNKFIKDVDQAASSLYEIEADKINSQDLISTLQDSPLFSPKKMIILNNVFDNKNNKTKQELIKYLNQQDNESDIIIFSQFQLKAESKLSAADKDLYKILKKSKYTQECKVFSNIELAQIINTKLQKYNITSDRNTINKLIELCKQDPFSIHNELNKILNFKEKGQKLTHTDLEDLVAEKFEEDIFSLSDAISAKQTETALKIIEEQYLAQVKAEYILSMLIRQFKILIQIRDALDLNYSASKITSIIKLHPYVIKKGISQAKNFSKSDLIQIFNKFTEIEHKSRQGGLDLKHEINLLVAKI